MGTISLITIYLFVEWAASLTFFLMADLTLEQPLVIASSQGAVPGSIQIEIIRHDGVKDNCGECTLQIFKAGQVVFDRSSDECPEVEILDSECELSDRTEVIQIEKTPFLERIEVRNQSIDPIYVSPLEAPLLDVNSLPDECLNIYKTYVGAPPILSNYVPLPGFLNPYEFVAQIGSDPSCPPPQYEVICSCEGEECPNGTCPVECNGTVCCYEPSTGQSIAEIPLENYTGGGI